MRPDDDHLRYWRQSLAALAGTEQWPKLAPDEIHAGYYRMRRKGGNWEALSFQIENDYWVCLRNGVPQPTDKIAGLFMSGCRNPVPEDAYERAIDGRGWEDEPVAPIGHNLPADTDPVDRLTIEFAGDRELADEMLAKPVTTQAEADRLAIWTDRIQAISKAAKAEHDVEKKPVLDEAKRIEQRWSPLLVDTERYAKKMKAHALPWLAKLDQLERERQASAHRDAEALRAKARQMAEAATGDEDLTEVVAVVNAAREAELAAEFRNPQAGRKNAKLHMRSFYSALIVDYDKTLAAVKDRPQVRDLVQTLANAAARHGEPLAGTQRVEARRAV